MSQILVSNEARTIFVEVTRDEEGDIIATCPEHGVLDGDRNNLEDNIMDAEIHVDRFHENGNEDR